MKRVAIIQSNYIPWKGYFDMINMSDEFILLDEVQFTRRDWRNRNQIKTNDGLKWLSIPVESEGNREMPINEVKVSDQSWRKKHWDSLRMNYGKTPFFKTYAQELELIYMEGKEERISEINYTFIAAINKWLGIDTKISHSTDYQTTGDKNQRLIELCKSCGASFYLSGPAAKSYLQEHLFEEQNIRVEWMDYSGYPEYRQSHPPFTHAVSILDMLFNVGSEAKLFMKSFG